MEKAFGKQIKTIEDQGEKQIKAKTIKKYAYDAEDKEIFNELVEKKKYLMNL